MAISDPDPRSLQDPALVEAIKSKLEGVGLPILYVHPDETESAFAVVVEIEHWQKIMALIPKGGEITDLVMAHAHLVASGYE